MNVFKLYSIIFASVLCGAGILSVRAQSVIRVNVDAGAAGIPISPTLYGIFFEDINFAADGGLSAELVKNGSFEFMDAMTGWRKIENSDAVGGFGVRDDNPPFPGNPHYARLTLQTAGQGIGMRNEGFRGMGFKKGAHYRFSAMTRLISGEPQVLRVELCGGRDVVVGAADVHIVSRDWTHVDVDLVAMETAARGAMRVLMRQARVIDLEAVSLMPMESWKGRANGLRPDLVQMLADLKPGFIRFPGGCIVEGRTLSNRYQWKTTVGPVDNRKVIYNRWNVEFAGGGRGAADYFQSFHVGFFEYFLLCEDIGAEPVPILNCGMACQYNSGELATSEELGPYVHDALDLVEFANGPATSRWGRVRAGMGHPEPFKLRKLGIGNEQWGPQYFERYEVMAKAVRARYPEIELIVSAGPGPDGGRFNVAWKTIPGVPADIVDEHCYASPAWFLDNATRYDHQDRKGPKIFMGEYAAHVASKRNVWEAALAEAAFMTGLERNADVVEMSSYAPLFAHVDAWQWSADLIWFDSLRSFATPNYHVQRLFSLNRGDVSLPVKLENLPLAANGKPRFYVVASRDKGAHELIVKVVNATAEPRSAILCVRGAGPLDSAGRAIVLAADLRDENSLEMPDKVAPRDELLANVAQEFSRTFPANSVTVLRVKEQ